MFVIWLMLSSQRDEIALKFETWEGNRLQSTERERNNEKEASLASGWTDLRPNKATNANSICLKGELQALVQNGV